MDEEERRDEEGEMRRERERRKRDEKGIERRGQEQEKRGKREEKRRRVSNRLWGGEKLG